MGHIELDQQDKIDYIYETLKKQESRYMRALIIKWIFRFFIIGFLFFFYFFILPKLDVDKIVKDYITPKVSQILTSIVGETMKSMTSDMINSSVINIEKLFDQEDLKINGNLDLSKIDTKKAEIIKKLQELKSK